MAAEAISVFTKLGVDATAVGDTTVFTAPVGAEQWCPVMAIIVPQDASALLTGPTISIGKVGAAFDDVVAATALIVTDIDELTDVYNLTIKKPAYAVDSGETLKIRVSVAATTGGGGACKLNVIVYGFFIPQAAA